MDFKDKYTKLKDGTAGKVVRKVARVVGARPPITTTAEDNERAFGETYEKLFKK